MNETPARPAVVGGPSGMGILPMWDRLAQTHGRDVRATAEFQTPPTTGKRAAAVPPGLMDRCGHALRFLARLPVLTLLALIRVYQCTLSPALPVITAGACGCRFSPTCSHYAAEAVRTHGALAGTWLALRRLLKCTPLHPGGFDPVPPRPAPRCERPATPAGARFSPPA